VFGRVKDYTRRIIHERLWEQRLNTYNMKWAISTFAAKWAARWWDVTCEVIPPPVLLPLQGRTRRLRVVVLGRFVSNKRQLEVIRAFRAVMAALPGWELVCMGGLSDIAEDREYFTEVEQEAKGAPIRLLPNVGRKELVETLQSCELFVHAMGYGVEEESMPLDIEHFGIATVEAMAAGCVPLVIGVGGQAEIVRHQVDGLHWVTLEELSSQLVRLGTDAKTREQMRASAIVRAKEYSLERFASRVQDQLAHLITLK